MPKKNKANRSLKPLYVFYALIALVVVLTVIFKDMLFPFLAAILLAYVLNPIVSFFERRRIHRLIAISALFVVFGGVIYLLSSVFIVRAGEEVFSMYAKLPKISGKIQRLADNISGIVSQTLPLVDKADLSSRLLSNISGVTERLGEYLVKIFSTAMTGLGAIAGGIKNVLIVVFVSFFILKDWNRIRKKLEGIVPGKYAALVKSLMTNVNIQIGRYLRGQLLVACSVGLLSFLGLTVLGFEYAFLLGLIAGVTNLVPLLGPAAGIAAGLLISFFSPQPYLFNILKVVSVLLAVQLLDNTLLSPMIIGKSVKIHPVTVMLVILFGAELMGIFGMLIAVPCYVSLKAVGFELYRYFAKAP